MSARLLVLVVLLYGAAAAQTLRYTVLSNSVATGSEVDTYHADGSIDSTYEYNDRGRGPKVTAHYAIRGDGLPIGTDIKGNDYWKAPVDEHFFLENGEAHWHSTSENGKSAPGFYLSVNGPPAEMALLVAMLIKAKGAPVHLLPAGEASLERLAEPPSRIMDRSSTSPSMRSAGFRLSRRWFGSTTICVSSDRPAPGLRSWPRGGRA